MRSQSSRAFATRLPPRRADRLEAAIEETGSTQAELVRRALVYYINRNPDEIAALYSNESVGRFIRNMERGFE